MQVTFIPGKDVNSDLGVVNAARVSLDRKSEWDVEEYTYPKDIVFSDKTMTTTAINATRQYLKKEDAKLIKYLASHNHWTPFSHARLYFQLMRFSGNDRLYFYEHANQAGFGLTRIDKRWYLKGSLYGFLMHIKAFRGPMVQDTIGEWLYSFYPVSLEAYVPNHTCPSFHYGSGVIATDEEYIALIAPKHPELYKLLTATLYVKVPIFVARQIRTSQVGLAYSDCYVEGEAFSYNEVSRRYVNAKPEFYWIKQWRVREGRHMKQGSTGLANEGTNEDLGIEQIHNLNNSQNLYARYNEAKVAPEQLRALLPQSMYTEFYMTGSLHRWAQWIALRQMPDVQEETREACSLVTQALQAAYPAWSSHYNL